MYPSRCAIVLSDPGDAWLSKEGVTLREPGRIHRQSPDVTGLRIGSWEPFRMLLFFGPAVLMTADQPWADVML